MKLRDMVLMIPVVFLLAACNGGGGDGDASDADSVDVTGTWAWRRMYDTRPEDAWHNGLWMLTQVGTVITGTYQALCHDTAAQYQNITGTIVDGIITFTNGRVNYTGTVNGTTMTGTWQYEAAEGPPGTEPWDATKQ